MTMRCEPTQGEITMPLKQFLLAGKAVLTVTVKQTGKHYTYRVNKAEATSKAHRDNGPVWFVNLGIGYDDSIYIGMIGSGRFFATAKSTHHQGSPPFDTFKLLYDSAMADVDVSPVLEVLHEGRCCVCSRPLTNPDSIKAGIGPECAGKE